MTRRQKRKLVRKAKEAAVLGAMLYLAAGMTVTGQNKESGTRRSYNLSQVETIPGIQTELPETSEEPEVTVIPNTVYEKYDLTSHEKYLLEKIAMAETESEDTECKALVMLVVLNRVQSSKFPDSVEEVIFEEKQFTPISNGRFDRVEPDQDCREAFDLIQGGWDESCGALYFELTTDEKTWHNTHLIRLFDRGATTFYTEKE